MDEQHRGIALVILGIIAIIAVIGLVLMFSRTDGSAGAVFTSATGGNYVCPVATSIAEPQWFPVLAGPYENREFLARWQAAGYECVPAAGAQQFDEYTFDTWCCRNPIVGQAGINPQVLQRGGLPLDTRQGYGTPVGQLYPQEKAYPALPQLPRVGP